MSRARGAVSRQDAGKVERESGNDSATGQEHDMNGTATRTGQAGATGVRPEIASIIAEVFQYTGAIGPETSQEDVPKWDSLQHIALVTAIEQSFGITLSMEEMLEIRTVGDIDTILARHGV